MFFFPLADDRTYCLIASDSHLFSFPSTAHSTRSCHFLSKLVMIRCHLGKYRLLSNGNYHFCCVVHRETTVLLREIFLEDVFRYNFIGVISCCWTSEISTLIFLFEGRFSFMEYCQKSEWIKFGKYAGWSIFKLRFKILHQRLVI